MFAEYGFFEMIVCFFATSILFLGLQTDIEPIPWAWMERMTYRHFPFFLICSQIQV